MLAWGSIRVIRVALGPPKSRNLPQSCLIHLQHAATTKHLNGNHRIIEYKDFTYPNPKDYELELWTSKPLRKTKDKISLFDVLQDHLKPGLALLPLESSTLDGLPEINIPRYRIGELNIEKVYQTKNKKGKGRGSKEFHFKTDVDTGHLAHSLYKSYHFLSRTTNRSRIEIHIHHPIKKKKKDSLPSLGANTIQQRNEILEGHKRLFLEAVHKALHLWPETILRAMPESTRISISPVANKDNVCWVMDLGGKDITKVFQKNRSIHEQRFENCDGLLDKETRRNVKQDVRTIRLQVRSDLEILEKEERLERKKSSDAEKNQFHQTQADTQSAVDILPLEKIDAKQPRLEKASFGSLTAQISFDDIEKSKNIPALIQLKALIHEKIQRKGNVGLLEQCEFEMLRRADLVKIILIALLQVTERVAELNQELEHGSAKLQRENDMILERSANLYKGHSDAKQLQEEIKRRLGVDLEKVKRKSKDKIEKESKKLMRRRYKLFDYLEPDERRIVSSIEGGRPFVSFPEVKKPKEGWTWKSRGASRS
ncbi:hypothetical protein OnM2_020051 [Erysiphe neolycopersici]|uniref:Uncharacterized protein n=1 Tax=Erysiphe neolycopersici TaxID=212602 RepID=A0A420I3L2_9PEZI|nr:hypothetical protein OnM2_020051 [Erysiphe neolycopersici]